MGELRTYVLPVRALRTLVLLTPERRELVAGLAAPLLRTGPPPAPLGPLYARVPGTPVLRDDDPTPADLDVLVSGAPVPRERARATWRLVEAVAAQVAVARSRFRTDRPDGLGPIGLDVPEVADLVVGAWPLALARDRPALRGWLEAESSRIPADGEPPDVLVFWSRNAGGGPPG